MIHLTIFQTLFLSKLLQEIGLNNYVYYNHIQAMTRQKLCHLLNTFYHFSLWKAFNYCISQLCSYSCTKNSKNKPLCMYAKWLFKNWGVQITLYPMCLKINYFTLDNSILFCFFSMTRLRKNFWPLIWVFPKLPK